MLIDNTVRRNIPLIRAITHSVSLSPTYQSAMLSLCFFKMGNKIAEIAKTDAPVTKSRSIASITLISLVEMSVRKCSPCRIGISITIIFTIIAFFAANIYLVLMSLIFAAFGMAVLEPTAEAYFLEILKEKEVSRFYGPFYTTHDLNQFIIKIISSLILLVLPFKFLFIFFSLALFIMLLLTVKMKDISEQISKSP